MNLRDKFALEILKHQLKSTEYDPNTEGDVSDSILARDAYRLADEMMNLSDSNDRESDIDDPANVIVIGVFVIISIIILWAFK